MIRDYFRVVGKRFSANSAEPILVNDFPVQEVAHCGFAAQLTEAARVRRVRDAANTWRDLLSLPAPLVLGRSTTATISPPMDGT